MSELQNKILEMMAKGEPLGATVHRLCQEVDKIVPDAICSVLGIDSAGRLRPLSAPSLPEAYTAQIDGLAIGPDVGTCGRAAFLGEEVTSQDIANDPHWAGFRDLLLPIGLRACWSRPIFGSDDRPVATFAFYYRAKRGPSQAEREIVDQCAHLCAIALDRHQRVLERERRANIDDLTGLHNRGAFNAALAALDCSVPGTWALCVIDIDNLKVVNDTFGHKAGDMLLKRVSDRLSVAASQNLLFRIGGDEFAIIVHDAEALMDLDRTVSGYLSALAPSMDCGGSIIVPRATIGFAILSPEDRLSESVHHNADFALYHAKETGRGGFVRYWPGIGTRMTRRLTAIREVGAALREGRIEAHYQPISKLDTGEVVGLEALCRMRIGNQFVSASSFHEATTDASIASTLTEQMITQVAADVRVWLDMGIPFQYVGINVSSVDFHKGTIYSFLAEKFENQGVPLKHVILEVTESVYIDDAAGVVRKSIADLRAKGLKLALDDFGTGFASLTHLISVPVDIIKIDKSFVDGITSSVPCAAIVEGIIGIARKLGIKVIAEGVESAEQVRQLMDLGCELGQGYYYSPAINCRDAGGMMMKSAESIIVPETRSSGTWTF